MGKIGTPGRVYIVSGVTEISAGRIKFGVQGDGLPMPNSTIRLLAETRAWGWVVHVETVAETGRCVGTITRSLRDPSERNLAD